MTFFSKPLGTFRALIIIVSFILGCNSEISELPPDSMSPEVLEQSGMRFVVSEGNQFSLGSRDQNAKKTEEWPLMPTAFTYNFSLDSFEVTVGQWREVMGNSDPRSSVNIANDRNPQVNITWFDAILFCNARSKLAGLDTVYSYSSLGFDKKGHVVEIQNLKVAWKNMGFRLPTEAEWQWCASEGGNLPTIINQEQANEVAWNSMNSEGTLHPVGSKKPNTWGFYDLYGNAMEWTFDWMGSYWENEVQNFVGASNPNQWLEKVVKGGSYVSAWSQLRAAARSSTYPMTASTSTEYLGFRCAIGPIPNVNYLGPTGESQTPFAPVSSLDTSWMKNMNALLSRIALVRMMGTKRYLQILEFKQGTMKEFETREFSSVFTPSISPDGQWVAFGDAFEGMKSKGTVRVCDIHLKKPCISLPAESAYIPRWRVDAVSLDTFLVFSTNGYDNTDNGFKEGSTYQIQMVGGQPQGALIQISIGSFHDGLSSDGRWLATGYRHLIVKDLQSGTERTLFTSDQNGKVNEDTSQVCNVSMQPGTGRNDILFLDFGSQDFSSLVGRSYAIHEVAFLGSPNGNIKTHFFPPKGYDSFQDLEWSTDSGFAISVLQSDARPYSTLGILDIANRKSTAILAADNVADPHLWFGHGEIGADSSELGPSYLDSLGRYAEPYVLPMQHIFAAKLEVLLNHLDSTDIVCVGTSESDFGIQPKLIKSGRALNLAVSSSSLATQLTMVRNYAMGHMPNLKAIVFEVFLGSLPIHQGDFHFECCIESTRGYQFDRSHGFWPTGFPKEMFSLVKNSNALADLGIDSLGNMPRPGIPWVEAPALVEGLYKFKAEDSIVQENLKTIEDFVGEMNDSGLAVLLVQLPENPNYALNEYVTRGGPSRTEADKIHAQIRQFCAGARGCGYYDGHNDGKNDYIEFDFVDWNHLSVQGAARFTPRLDSALSEVMNRF